jgi:hypothetical protein
MLAVVTDVGLGASITNSIEDIWDSLAARLGEPLFLFEHWTAQPAIGEEEHLDQVVVHGRSPSWRRIWPTPASNTWHAEFETWMARYGHRILAASSPL